MEELVKYMKALTFLQVQQMTGNTTFVGKPELLLSKAGFTAKEIAHLVGKKEAAVAQAIHRAKNSKNREE